MPRGRSGASLGDGSIGGEGVLAIVLIVGAVWVFTVGDLGSILSDGPIDTQNADGIADGTMTSEFADCTEGLVTYELTSPSISGTVPIQRITNDNVSLCEVLSGQQ